MLLGACALCDRRRRIDLGDLAEAIGGGGMRSGNERAAHLRAVPARGNAKPERLVSLDVAGREKLHEIDFQVRELLRSMGKYVSGRRERVQSPLSRSKSANTAAT